MAPNGGLYKANVIKGTGGWIGTLQNCIMHQIPELELGITFKSNDTEYIHESSVYYYPVSYHSGNSWSKLANRLFLSEDAREKKVVERYLEVINSFKPEVVHIWGLEDPSHAMLIPKLDIPFVVHIQGLTSFILQTYCPPFFSITDLKKADWSSLSAVKNRLTGKGIYSIYKDYCYRAEMELKYGSYVKNWIGRTEWDKIASQMLSAQSRYYYGDELMRDDFKGYQWHYHYNGKLSIQSSLSTDWYKGVDVILRTAKIMKDIGHEFTWNVYGIGQCDTVVRYMVRKLRISPTDVNVVFRGRVPGKTICEGLLSSDVFVHTSYIENSSNAIAEAMQLGVPIVAQNVGGLSSLLSNNSGKLVPTNEPYILANAIINMKKREIAEEYSNNSLKVSKGRSDSEKLIYDLYNTYKEVIKNG